MRAQLAAFLLSLVAALPAHAGVEQFIDDQTVLAGAIDLQRIEPAAVEAFLFDAMKTARAFEPGPGAADEKEVRQQLAQVNTWLSDLKRSGATAAYITGNAQSLKLGPPTVIVAVPDDKAAAVASLLYSGKPDGPTGPAPNRAAPNNRSRRQNTVETLPGVGAVMGNAAGVAYVKAIQPKERPDLKAALAAAGDAPARIAIGIDPIRAELQKNVPPEAFGHPTALLWRDAKWASLSAALPPKPSLKLIIQSANAESAKQTHALLTAVLGMGRLRAPTITPEQVQLLTPALQNDQLVIALDDKQIATIATALAEPLREARMSAMRVQSMSNMRQLLVGIHMYAADNKGKWPDDLAALEKYLGGAAQAAAIMTNPQRPDVKPAYVYLKPVGPPANASTAVVLYESHTDFGNGVGVGFGDGHVEYVSNRARFDQLLAGADPAAAPPK